ncbi:hypothetical protein DM50_2914 [Burkholderia mallei]|nr:hypothetical protein DM50_2914 [Burkholderia mallei]
MSSLLSGTVSLQKRCASHDASRTSFNNGVRLVRSISAGDQRLLADLPLHHCKTFSGSPSALACIKGSPD